MKNKEYANEGHDLTNPAPFKNCAFSSLTNWKQRTITRDCSITWCQNFTFRSICTAKDTDTATVSGY